MDFRFLGPLEVRSEGAPLPLGGQKQRGILAVLLLNANTVVSTDRIVDDVWGETAPRTVQAYVQNCVSRLRILLGRQTIETHAAGYLLRVGPEDVDALRFEQAVEAARSLEPPERVATLAEALALWRGTPLAEFAYEPFARPEVARLEELRLEAVEARLQAELELGRHAIALPELEALAARHPARERLRYLQMLALYRADRQRDALAVYHETRRELVEQYGLEPGDDLRSLQRMILDHDPALDRRGRGRRASPAGHRIVLAAAPADAAAEDVVRRSGGTVVSRGRALVAVYGVPHAEDGDALRALRAAGELHAGGNVRVAVDRAPAAERERSVHTLLDAAAAGATIVGDGTLALVAHAVDVVANPGGGFRVLHVDPGAEAVPRRFDTPFVGRSRELERLHAELASAAENGRPKRLLILGDAGIGKTRLAREFAARAPAAFLGVRCRPHSAADPIDDLLAQVGSPERLLAGDPDAGKVAAALRDRGRSGHAGDLWSLRRLLEGAARAAPLVLVLDDLQWAPPALLDLLDYLAGWAQAPLLVLGLARPEALEARPGLEAHALFLDPLPRPEAERLVRGLVDDLPSRDADAVAVTGEGNPLYLEQLAAWRSENRERGVPPTIDLLVAMRVERLPAAERRVLERASIAGTEFWRGAVEAASPEDERTEVSAALMALARRRLVHPAPSHVPGEDGFRFHHALIRDVVYGGLPADERARVHAAIARSLGPDAEHDALAGHHLEQAAAVDETLANEAARRLGAAGMRALRRIDAARAADLLARAASLGRDEAATRELEWGAATALKFAGDPRRADELLDDVARRSAAGRDELNVVRARIEQVWPRLSRGVLGVDEALALLERGVPVLEAAGDDFALARAWDVTGAVRGVYLLQAEAGERAEERARALYERAGSTTGAASVRLAGAAYLGPRTVEDATSRCVRLLAEAETPVWASFVLPFLAALHSMAGRFDEARAELEEARLGRAEFADTGTLATSWSLLAAEVAVRAGDLDHAEATLTDACHRLREAGDGEWLALNGAALAEVLARQGRAAEALAAAEAALAGAPPAHLTALAYGLRARALALARLGETRRAVPAAREAVAALERSDVLVERGRTLAVLAEALARDGDTAASALRRAEAVTLLERKGDHVLAREVAASG